MVETEEKQMIEIPSTLPQEESADLLLHQLVQQTEAQTELLKKQLLFTRLGAMALAGLLVLALLGAVVFAPRLTRILNRADMLMEQATVVLADLSEVSAAVAEADVGEILANLDTLVRESQQGVTRTLGEFSGALDTLRAIDIAGLNRAIGDLEAVVRPLSKLFGGGS